MMFVLDTDHVSLFQRRHPVVVEKIQRVPVSQLAVTIVTRNRRDFERVPGLKIEDWSMV